MKVINPATGDLILELEEDSSEQIQEKFKRTAEAQKLWNQESPKLRKDVILKFKDLLNSKIDSLAKTLTLEVGKPIAQSRNEVKGTSGRIDFFAENFEPFLKDETVFQDPTLIEKISQEPLGVIANISAWNYPYFVGANVFIPALLTGNAVLYKPSEFASITGLEIASLLHQAGVPKDIFVPIIGDGRAGADLLQENIKAVFFTGSFFTGQRIGATAAQKMIKVQLELGGKDPIYVCEDVNIKAAAEGTSDGAFYNSGQSCCSVERIYIHEKIFDSFVEAFLASVRGFKMGDPLDEKTYLGPLTRQAQLDVLDRHVKDALSKGAKLLTGGRRVTGPGNYFEPTVLVDVNHTMEVMSEESFGPIIGLQKVKDDDEAIRLMNDTQYGLTAGVYTQNKNRAESLLKQLNSGSVYWNCCDRVSPRLPWSGRVQSGIGVTLSHFGIQTFLQPKAWHLRLPSGP